jgi:two-component system, OmpR family, response regulator
VLVVEDDPGARGALRYVFSRAGHHVTLAATLAEALLELRRHEPDLVVLDLMLPDGDGEVVLQSLRASGSNVRVAVTTGVMEPQRLQRVQALNPTCVLLKPINVNDLLRCL